MTITMIRGSTGNVTRRVAAIGPPLSAVVWIIALLLPAFEEASGRVDPGNVAFALGWLASPIAGLANVFLWTTYVAGWRRHPALAVALSVAAIACAAIGLLTFMGSDAQWCFGDAGCQQMGGKGWQALVGVPVWIVSMVMVFVSSLLRLRRPRPAAGTGVV